MYHHLHMIPKLNRSIWKSSNELTQVNHFPPKWFGSKELSGNLQECMVASTVPVTRFLNIRQKHGSGRIYTAKKKNIHMFFWW